MNADATNGHTATPQVAGVDVVRSLFREIDDDKCAAILRLGATTEDLETVAAYLAGEDDVMGKTGHPLSGIAAAAYEILTAEEPDEDEG